MRVKIIVEEAKLVELAKQAVKDMLANPSLRVVSTRVVEYWEDPRGIEVEVETDPSVPVEG